MYIQTYMIIIVSALLMVSITARFAGLAKFKKLFHGHIWKETKKEKLRRAYEVNFYDSPILRTGAHNAFFQYYAVTYKCVVCDEEKIVESREKDY